MHIGPKVHKKRPARKGGVKRGGGFQLSAYSGAPHTYTHTHTHTHACTHFDIGIGIVGLPWGGGGDSGVWEG